MNMDKEDIIIFIDTYIDYSDYTTIDELRDALYRDLYDSRSDCIDEAVEEIEEEYNEFWEEIDNEDEE